MSKSEALLTIGEVIELPPGDASNASWINPGFQGVIELVSSFDAKKSGKTFYNVTVVDPDTGAAIHALFGKAPKFSEGQTVSFTGQGLRRQEYNGKPQFAVSDKTEIHILAGAPAGRDTLPPQRTATSSPPAAGQTRQLAGPGGAQPTVFGATVGMAINQANEILRFIYPPAELKELLKSPHYSATLHEIASDIIRIALLLEKGKLAEKVRVRCGLEEPEPAGPTQEEREAEELAKQQARIEQERVAEAKRKKAVTRHGVDPDEDVPF